MLKGLTRIVIYLSAFIVILLFVILLGQEITGYKKTVEAPLLVGKDINEVKKIIMRKGLSFEIEEEVYNAEFPKGTVIRQTVKPGKRIEKGSEIGIVISKGVEMFSMPSFEGQILDDAKLTMINLGLKIGKITWVHSDTVGKGRIIAQRPLPGNVRENEVNLLVSLGGYSVSYKCPSFVNMTIEDARRLAEALGIRLIEHGSGSRVIFQKPEAETVIERGDRVEVTLGRGWGFWF